MISLNNKNYVNTYILNNQISNTKKLLMIHRIHTPIVLVYKQNYYKKN